MSVAFSKSSALSFSRDVRQNVANSLGVSTWRLTITCIVVALIQVLSSFSPITPSPWRIAVAVIRLLSNSGTYWHFGVTFFEALSGIVIAGALGLALGIAAGANRNVDDFISPVVLAIYSIPKIVFLPILMILLGSGVGPKIGNAAFHAFFPIMLNTLTGIQGVKALHLKIMRSVFATRIQILFNLYLPSMVLPVFAGFRLAMGLAVLGAVLAELFEAKAGVGYIVMNYYSKGMMPEMIGIVFLMLVAIVAVNAALTAVERHLSRWRGVR